MNKQESKKSKSSKSLKSPKKEIKKEVKTEPDTNAITSNGSSGGKKRKSSDHHSSGKSSKKEKKSHSSSSSSSSSSKKSVPPKAIPEPPSKPSTSTSSSKPIKPSKPSPSSHFLSSSFVPLPPPPPPPPVVVKQEYSSSPSSSTISNAYNNNIVNNFIKPKPEPIGFGSKVRTRSKVYSGTVRATNTVDNVMTLEKLCIQVLMDNYANITHLGNAPYWLIKPILEKCSSSQLFTLEDYNPRLTEDDDELWKWHCEKEFRNWRRQEDETWRDLFIRAEQERKRKLEIITRNIDLKEKARGPVRKTQLAYTEPKAPRNVKKVQDKSDKGFVKASRPQSVSSDAPSTAKSTPAPAAKKQKGLLMKNALKMMQTIRRQY